MKTKNSLPCLDQFLPSQWFDDNRACADGKEWVLGVIGEGMTLRKLLPRFDRADWMLWTLKRIDNPPSRVQFVELAVICAQTVLHIYEKKYPKNDRPRKAIEAATVYVKEPTEQNRQASTAAATAAANAAADAAANAADATSARKSHHKNMCDLIREKIAEWDS
jgi:hypothetical protein